MTKYDYTALTSVTNCLYSPDFIITIPDKCNLANFCYLNLTWQKKSKKHVLPDVIGDPKKKGPGCRGSIHTESTHVFCPTVTKLIMQNAAINPHSPTITILFTICCYRHKEVSFMKIVSENFQYLSLAANISAQCNYLKIITTRGQRIGFRGENWLKWAELQIP